MGAAAARPENRNRQARTVGKKIKRIRLTMVISFFEKLTAGAIGGRGTKIAGRLTRQPGYLNGDPWFSVPASRQVWLFF
jgi:hypothetical protein